MIYWVKLFGKKRLKFCRDWCKSMYCKICGDELSPEEEAEGICKICKNSQIDDPNYKKDDDYIDPGVT